MTTYNTGNPLGSGDPRDLYDNAQNFDLAINGNGRKWLDRLGVERYTWEGALANIAPLGHPWTEEEANAAIASGEIPNGAYYFVWSSDKNNIADVWHNVNGVATKTDKSYPSSEFVSELSDKVGYLSNQLRNVQNIKGVKDEMGNEIIAGIASENGKIPLYVNSNGDSFLSGLRIINLGDTPGIVYCDSLFRPYACSPGYPNPEGLPVIGDFGGSDEPVIKIDLIGIMGIETEGQSLSLGVTKPDYVKLVNTTQPYLNQMFSGTIRSTTPETDTSVPLVETNKVLPGAEDFPQSETYLSSFVNELTRKLMAERGVTAATDLPFSFFGAAHGVAGLKLVELIKGTASYDTFLKYVTNAKRLANASGKTYLELCGFLSQGESDYRDQTPPKDWEALLVQYLADKNQDVKAITGQKFDRVVVAAQLASHRAYTRVVPTIALSIAKLARQGYLQIGYPAYVGKYVDSVHMSPDEYIYCGRLAQRSLHRALQRNREGKPFGVTWLAIIDEFVQGTIHVYTYNVPTKPIRIRTDWVWEIVNYGFAVVTKDTNAYVDIINSVSVTAEDQITVITSRPLTTNEVMTYGWGVTGEMGKSGRINGPRGNICDSSGDVPGESYTDSVGVLRPMDDYAEIWKSEL
ncbi:TPA: hypothetical protein I9774_000515 [Serratia marcescens]|nr:hypothetical protein [Serratia marcescens]